MLEKIKIGVLGAGRWGPNLIRSFHTFPTSTVVAVVDKDLKQLQKIQERYPDIKVSDSEDLVLKNPHINAVVICTPTQSHYGLALKALENKKHLFVEKPLATTVQDCEQLVELARRQDLVLFVGHVFIYNAGIRCIKNYIKDGELGPIYYIHATRTNLGPIRDDVNALWDLAPHDLSIFEYWLEKMPLKVTATGGKFLNHALEDVVFATYIYPPEHSQDGKATRSNNVLAHIHVSWLNPKKIREIIIVGEKKMLVWDDMDLQNPIRIYDKKVVFKQVLQNRDPYAPTQDQTHTLVDTFVKFRASIQEGETFLPKIPLNEPLQSECLAFLEVLKNPTSSESSGVHGTHIVKALAATEESLKQNSKTVFI